MREFFMSSNYSEYVIHFNFNFMLFALVRRAPIINFIIYSIVNKATLNHIKCISRKKKSLL